MIVFKIGGSCLSSKDGIKRTTELVKEWKRESPVLVVSALKGITDELLTQADEALTGHFDLGKIQKIHHGFLRDIDSPLKEETKKCVDSLLEELDKSLLAVGNLNILSPRDRDTIISFGEKLATEIVAGHLKDSGVEAVPLWDIDAGIVTTSDFGNAYILEESIPLMKKRLYTNFVPVVAGFFGRDEKGRIATLGREGSDYTATFISAALRCPVILFKDVDGLMTADPKVVENASIIDKINYMDVLELARYGTKVIHEKALMPAIEARIPIKIKNFFKPSEGTMICSEGEANVISFIPRVAKVNLFNSSESINILSSLLHKLNISDINPLLLSKTSRSGLSFVVREGEHESIKETIERTYGRTNIETEIGIGLVAAIGNRVQEKGVYSVSKLLADNNIKINTIAKSSNSKNLCVIVDEQDIKLTVRLLHNLYIDLEVKNRKLN